VTLFSRRILIRSLREPMKCAPRCLDWLVLDWLMSGSIPPGIGGSLRNDFRSPALPTVANKTQRTGQSGAQAPVLRRRSGPSRAADEAKNQRGTRRKPGPLRTDRCNLATRDPANYRIATARNKRTGGSVTREQKTAETRPPAAFFVFP
jgi:hypothetical protein